MRWLIAMVCALVIPMSAWGAEIMDSSPASSNASDREAAGKGTNAFAADLYGQLRTQDGNLFFSPESISTALAMTYAGARGDTAVEMAKSLHFTLPQERLHPAIGGLLRDLNAGEQAHGYQLKAANALWAQQGYEFTSSFLALLKNNYDAGLTTLDFATAAESARTTINRWVEEQTANKIHDLIPPNVVNAGTRLVLTNAVYFKGIWQKPFDKAQTRNEDFHISVSQSVRVPLMHSFGRFNYMQRDIFQVLELPYNGQDLSMIIFLPKEPDELPALEASLTQEAIAQSLAELAPASKVDLSLPKFKVTAQFNLSKTLKLLGMKLAFDPDHADFSGMTSAPAGLCISDVIHKSYVDVNEEGTEAAAATAVLMPEGARPSDDTPILFHADHPFIFLIRENFSGSILFMGRMNNPAS